MINKIINLFKTKTVPRERIYDLDDWHPLKDRYEAFHDIIEKALEKRDNNPEWAFTKVMNEGVDYLFKQRYIEWMCEEIQKEFNVDVSINKIIELDINCSGHVDYVYKFAFRLAELEEKLKGESYDTQT